MVKGEGAVMAAREKAAAAKTLPKLTGNGAASKRNVGAANDLGQAAGGRDTPLPGLRLSDDFSLPLEAVTETFAILAKRGAGKTYAASVLAEEMLKAGQTVVVADPVGVWWGLRASSDGQGPGLPIAILGGDHADAPLSPDAGTLVADLAAEERLSLVLDMSQMTPPEQTRFMTGFAERLYQKNRQPLHLILDEADQFAPQTPEAGQQPLLWAMNRIVRLGRARGLGVTLISQRPAVVNKNVLTQTEVLVTLRLTSPQDRRAVEAWVSAHDAPGERQEMLSSLASLPVGTAWLWSPGWLDRFVKVGIRPRETFDSSATPKVGQARPEPVALAGVDVERLRERLAELSAAEDGEEMEPGELRRRLRAAGERIADLEKPGSEKQGSGGPVIPQVPVRVEVPILAAGQAQELRESAGTLLAGAETLRAQVDKMSEQVDKMNQAAQAILGQLDRVAAGTEKEGRVPQASPALPRTVPPPQAVSGGGKMVTPGDKLLGENQNKPGRKPLGEKMPLAERKILVALAQYPDGRSKRQVAILTAYAQAGGSFNNALGSLRSKGWMSGGREEALRITEDGLAALGTWEPLPDPGPSLADYWLCWLGKAERSILETLVTAYPAALTKGQIAQKSGYAAEGGSFNNALGRLRTLELVEGRGELRASPLLCRS